MFASRANQENVIHEQQTAAAAKPLNQGVKGLAPKTPGAKAPPKTPKVPLNDENATFKTGGKGGLFGDGKTGKADKSALVTPAGPKTRAPLGNKTTNAKAAHFQTPAPASVKGTSPRLRRAKIKVHEAEPETAGNGAEEREIEYMPPREVPLPDHPDDCWPADRTYPQFEGKNLTRGWWSEFSKQPNEDDEDEFSDFEEKLKALEQREKAMEQKEKALERQDKKAAGKAAGGTSGTPVKKAGLQAAKKDPLTSRAPQTLKARSAASALSGTSQAAASARLSAPKTRPTSTLAAKKTAAPVTAPSNARHTAAKVASNQTIGYSKGRAVSGAARKPLAQFQGKQVSAPSTKQPRNTSPEKKMLSRAAFDDLFGMPDLDIADDEEIDGLGGKKKVDTRIDDIDDEDDEEDAFLLEPVEL